MEAVQIIALTMGVAWASGINLYAVIATLGLLGAGGYMDLPPGLVILQDPVVIVAAGFMYCVEFFADKVPGVDTGWDTIHTFIRIPAAAILASQAVGDVDPAIALAAALLGGALGATSHTLKAGTRVLINASPEPFSNIGMSLFEDTVALAGIAAAVFAPVEFLVFMGLFVVAAAWIIPKIWRAIARFFARVFGRRAPAGAPSGDDAWPILRPPTRPKAAPGESRPQLPG